MATASSPPPIAQKAAAPAQPSLCIKPTPASASPPPSTATTPSSLMSKEWVVPPRPKPGRKPATDTPPTKRKAQNRAAQRAFRERRAARVGELEEQMKQVEEENEQEQDSLRDTVRRLEAEVEHYQSELTKWIARCRGLEKDLAHHHSSSSATDAVPLPRRANATSEAVPDSSTDVPMGCGNCSLETRCQCLDDAFDALNGTPSQPEPNMPEKRPQSPRMPASGKRIKLETNKSLEIDFTALYSSRPPAQPSREEVVSPTSPNADPCGFCQDGTPCICAEMAADAEQNQAAETLQVVANNRPLPRIHRLSQYTPPPSEGDVSSAPPQPANPCAAGPGTCAQCRTDPNSTLFCKSLAASRSLATDAQGGCCGGKTSRGGCCQSSNTSSSTAAGPSVSTRSLRSKATDSTPTALANSQGQAPTSITLTCADAYTTLSRHPAYTRASNEIATWMPRLHPNDAQTNATETVAPTAGVEVESRPAMDIDAANVMAVLKEFDRRFGAS